MRDLCHEYGMSHDCKGYTSCLFLCPVPCRIAFVYTPYSSIFHILAVAPIRTIVAVLFLRKVLKYRVVNVRGLNPEERETSPFGLT